MTASTPTTNGVTPIRQTCHRIFLEGAQEAGQALRVSQPHVCEFVGPEPAKIVVLLRCSVDGFARPTRDEECVHLKVGVSDRHRDGHGVEDLDTEFFEAFPDDGLVRELTRLYVPADKIPAVGVVATRRMAVRQEHATVPHEGGDCDLDLGCHAAQYSPRTVTAVVRVWHV